MDNLILNGHYIVYVFIIISWFQVKERGLMVPCYVNAPQCYVYTCVVWLAVYVCSPYTGQWLIVMLLSYYTLTSDKEKNV